MNKRDAGFNCSGVVRRALTKLAFCMAVALGLIAWCHAQGTIAFNNLANNDFSMGAQSGGLAHIFTPTPPSGGSWGLLNEDMNFELYAGSSPDSLQPVILGSSVMAPLWVSV